MLVSYENLSRNIVKFREEKELKCISNGKKEVRYFATTTAKGRSHKLNKSPNAYQTSCL